MDIGGNSEQSSNGSQKKKGIYKLSVKNVENSTSSLHTTLSLGDICWEISDSSIVTQVQTFYVLTDDDAFVMLQLGYTNIGLTPSCQVTARYYRPSLDQGDARGSLHQRVPSTPSSGKSSNSSLGGIFGSSGKKSLIESSEKPTDGIHEFISQNLSISGWNRSSDGFSSSIGPLSVHLRGPSESTGSEQSVFLTYKNEKITVELTLVPMVEPLQFGDGCVHVEKASLDTEDDGLGRVSIRHCPRMLATGKIFLRGIGKEFSCNGQASLIQITHRIKPYLLARSWSMAVFHANRNHVVVETQDSVSLIMLHLSTPSSVNHETMNQGILCIGSEVHALSLNGNNVQFLDSSYDHHSGKDVPTRMSYQWSGETSCGEPWSAKIHVEPKELMDRIDLLAQVPYLVRKIIQTFITKPFCYEWLDQEVILELSIGRDKEPRFVRGTLLHELSLL